MKNFLSSPVKVIGAMTYAFLMFAIYNAVKINEMFVANIFLVLTGLLIYTGKEALEGRK